MQQTTVFYNCFIYKIFLQEKNLSLFDMLYRIIQLTNVIVIMT